MLCWIIYNREDVEKNRRFIDFVSSGLAKYNVNTKLIILQEDGDIDNLIQEESPFFVINRSRNDDVAANLESKGIRVFNSAKVTKIVNNKKETYEELKGIVPFMPIVSEVEEMDSFPYVVKSVDGHGGNEVFMVENEEDKNNATQALKNKEYIAQACASDLGKDVRVYVIGNKIVAAMLRTSAEGFKSNYSLGGSVQRYKLNDNEKEMVRRIMKKLPMDYGAIDFIFHNNAAVFNEIEDAAGARMLYENTDIDIVQLFVNYIAKELSLN